MPKGEKQFNEMSTMSKAREYVAFGRLVIASDLHETCIPTDDAAVYVKPNGVRDYVEAIALLLDNEGVHQYLTGGPQALDRPGRFRCAVSPAVTSRPTVPSSLTS